MNKEEMIGLKYGLWTVTGFHYNKTAKQTICECECECGASADIRRYSLLNGIKKACVVCNDEGVLSEDEEDDIEDAYVLDTSEYSHALQKNVKKIDRYVIVSAQNATPVEEEFYDSLMNYINHTDSTFVVIPYRYRNPTSIFTNKQKDSERWDSVLVPYLMNERLQINNNLEIIGNVKIVPTNTRPLNRFKNTFTGSKSAIFGHPKLELETVATAPQDLPKILTTTGSVTKRNYSDTLSGTMGNHHHTFGATVLEVCGDKFFLRQIIADESGGFYDMDTYYSPKGVIEDKGETVEALVMGDIHVRQVDEDVISATFCGDESICGTLKPKRVLFHDVLDFKSRNHHERGSFVKEYIKHISVQESVEDEIRECVDFLDQHTPEYAKGYVVASNHDEAFDRWINEANPKNDHVNAWFYYQTMANIIPHPDDPNPSFKNPLQYWAKEWSQRVNDGEISFLERDQPFNVAGVELSNHGDVGCNGSRGSASNLSKIGQEVIIGHSHSPCIRDSVFQVGLSGKYDMGYNRGASSWLHCHCALYKNGKRTLLFIIDDKWRV